MRFLAPSSKKNHPEKKVIDYAFHNKKGDFADIYLMANCRFAVFPESGICNVPEIFHRPMVYVNYASFFWPSWWSVKGLKIFKRFKCLNSGEILPYKKVYDDFPVRQLVKTGNWSSVGLDLLQNSSEEIRDAVWEMDQRLNGEWEEKDEDLKLQARYWKMFDPPRPHTAELQVAATFVRKYPELFV